jgi:two-component system chemotaxis response regulator CheB
MLVLDDRIELTRGPRENWVRPAIDPLFRTAAEAHGPAVIGVVLTGRLNDGTAGLYEIKRRGGIAIVQTPTEAEASSMPQSALNNVAVDYCLPLTEMPRLLMRLAAEPYQKSFEREVALMEREHISEPVSFTCPECGGAMREETLGTLTRFRCHIGHVMTAEVLAATQADVLTSALSKALRLLNERRAYCANMADTCIARGDSEGGAVWRRAAEEAAEREETMLRLVEQKWTYPELAIREKKRIP